MDLNNVIFFRRYKNEVIQVNYPNQTFFGFDMINKQSSIGNQSFALWTGRMGKNIMFGDRDAVQLFYEKGMTLLNEDYYFKADYFSVKPESFIFDVLNDFILQCHQHGIFKHFESINLPHVSVADIKDPRKVLSLYMLSAGLYLWLICVAVACLVFLIEHVVRYFSRTRHLSRMESNENLVYLLFVDELD